MILLNILFTEKQLQKHYKIDAKQKKFGEIHKIRPW